MWSPGGPEASPEGERRPEGPVDLSQEVHGQGAQAPHEAALVDGLDRSVNAFEATLRPAVPLGMTAWLGDRWEVFLVSGTTTASWLSSLM